MVERPASAMTPGAGQPSCYLAERYLPRLSRDELLAVVERDRAAVANGACRHLQTIFIPDDETCFTLFAASEPGVIRDISERFDLGYRRIVFALDSLAPSPGPRASSGDAL